MNVIFTGNYARFGGGLCVSGFSSPTLIDCTFWNNTVYRAGGAIRCQQSSPTLMNCTLVENYAPENGGAILFNHQASMTLENCIIAFNRVGEAIYWGSDSEMTLSNCNIYGNDEGDWEGYIEDQLGVDGNISEDPLFCDPENGDFRLRENSPSASGPDGEQDVMGAWPVGCELRAWSGGP